MQMLKSPVVLYLILNFFFIPAFTLHPDPLPICNCIMCIFGWKEYIYSKYMLYICLLLTQRKYYQFN